MGPMKSVVNFSDSKRDTVIVNEDGTHTSCPKRADYPAHVEGAIEWLRAYHAFQDACTNLCNAAFGDTFRAAMRG